MQNHGAKMGGRRRFSGFERLEERIAPGAVWSSFLTSWAAKFEARFAPSAAYANYHAISPASSAHGLTQSSYSSSFAHSG